jgi:hypothetical protein
MPELAPESTPPAIPPHTPDEIAAQMVVKCCNSFLKTARLCLQALEEGLPYPEDSEAMGEWRVPQSVSFALRGILECVLMDDLEPAAQSLQEAADLTPETLYAEWQRKQAEREGR